MKINELFASKALFIREILRQKKSVVFLFMQIFPVPSSAVDAQVQILAVEPLSGFSLLVVANFTNTENKSGTIYFSFPLSFIFSVK